MVQRYISKPHGQRTIEHLFHLNSANRILIIAVKSTLTEDEKGACLITLLIVLVGMMEYYLEGHEDDSK